MLNRKKIVRKNLSKRNGRGILSLSLQAMNPLCGILTISSLNEKPSHYTGKKSR